ncbi:MAG TPA: urease subunit alpha, partial [Anaerovoracaceae bacterium]|nr:urease subunit alpha [Anaerovoracaceae bacterium]
MLKLSREEYSDRFGPTKDDKVRLADTSLFLRIEEDLTTYGGEIQIGMGRNVRDGIMASSRSNIDEAMDVVITNVIILDPVLGIVKGNIGIKEGIIAGIGNAGNPEIKDNVDLIVGPNTGVICGEGLIATPGGIDIHVHFDTARMMETALASGITTVIGGGSLGIWDISFNPQYYIHSMFEAFETLPLNVGLLGRGSSNKDAMYHNIQSGVCGMKIHEDTGADPKVIDKSLQVADEMDVQVCIHTDTMNESCWIEETIDAIAGRTIHAYHVEGVGGGHAPHCLQLASESNILASSTNPTLPFTVNTAAEHARMIMLIHEMLPDFPEDIRAANARVRPATMAAENVLHHMGAIPMIGSDSQGMGRMGETILRTWQTADFMKKTLDASDDNAKDDNEIILRYLAKYTINPAITHGISDYVGSLEQGKIADIVLWDPAFFGVKPVDVIKRGVGCYTPVGDGNATVFHAQPVFYTPGWGCLPSLAARLGISFV